MKKIFSFLMAALFSASMFAATYTVAGNSTVLFGSAWAPSDAANDMVLVEGLYKWSKSDVTLPVTSVDFKVCVDHSWDEAYPASDYKLAITEAGIYTIEITFNESTKDVNATATKTGSAVVTPTAKIAGSFNGWSGADMEIAADNKSASITLNLNEDNYSFKMIIADAWLGNGGTVTREANTVAGLNVNTDNMTLVADLKGDYTFTWTYETNTLVVTYPAGTPVVAKYYVTGDSAFVVDAGLDLEKKWNPAAIKVTEDVYEVSLKAGQIYQMVFSLDGTWDTKKGYSDVLEPAAGLSTDDEGNNNIVFSLAEAGKVKIAKTELGFKVEGNFYVYVPAHANGLYLMSSHNEWAVDDNYMFASTEVDGEYKLNVTLAKDQEIKPAYVENDAATVWYPAEGGNYVVTEAYAGDMTIYFRPAGNEDPAWVAFGGYMYITPNGGTGINNTAVEGKAVKTISNGQLVIEKNGVKFNVLGTVVR